MNGITREFLAEQWKRSAAEEEMPPLSSPRNRTKKEELRNALVSFFREMGLKPGDRLLVKRGDETRELNLDPFLDAQP